MPLFNKARNSMMSYIYVCVCWVNNTNNTYNTNKMIIIIIVMIIILIIIMVIIIIIINDISSYQTVIVPVYT